MRQAPARPVPSAHRLARLTTWVRLWLVCFVAAFMAGRQNGRGGAHALDPAARLVGQLVAIHAAARFNAPQRAHHRHGRRAHIRLRTVLGSRIRRALKAKDAPSRLHAILTIMRDLDLYVALVLKRLPRGLTRLRVILPKPAPAPLCAAQLRAAPCAADTS